MLAERDKAAGDDAPSAKGHHQLRALPVGLVAIATPTMSNRKTVHLDKLDELLGVVVTHADRVAVLINKYAIAIAPKNKSGIEHLSRRI